MNLKQVFGRHWFVLFLLSCGCMAEAEVPVRSLASVPEVAWGQPFGILSYQDLVALPLAQRTKYISELRRFLVQQEQAQAHYKNLFGWLGPGPGPGPGPGSGVAVPFPWWSLLAESAVANESRDPVFPDPDTGSCRTIESGRRYRRGVEYLISVHRDRCVIAGRVVCMALLPTEPHRLSCRLSHMPNAVEELGTMAGLNEKCSGDRPIMCQWPLYMRKNDSGPICKEARVGLTSICDNDENAKSSEEIAETLKSRPDLERAFNASFAAIRSYCGDSAQELKEINGFDRVDCERLHSRLAAIGIPRGGSVVAPAPAPAPSTNPQTSGVAPTPLDTCHVKENRDKGLPGFAFQVFKKPDGNLKYNVKWGSDGMNRTWIPDGPKSDGRRVDLKTPFALEDLGDGAAALLDIRSKNGKGPYNRIQFAAPSEATGGNYCWVIIATRYEGTLTAQNKCEVSVPGAPPVTVQVPNLPSKLDPNAVTTQDLFGAGNEREARVVPLSYWTDDLKSHLKTLFGENLKGGNLRGAWIAEGRKCIVSFSRREMVDSDRVTALTPAASPAHSRSQRPRRAVRGEG